MCLLFPFWIEKNTCDTLAVKLYYFLTTKGQVIKEMPLISLAQVLKRNRSPEAVEKIRNGCEHTHTSFRFSSNSFKVLWVDRPAFDSIRVRTVCFIVRVISHQLRREEPFPLSSYINVHLISVIRLQSAWNRLSLFSWSSCSSQMMTIELFARMCIDIRKECY